MRAQVHQGTRARGSARERLLAVAEELFFAEGIHNTGITLLIERADIAKATFYSAFKSKNDLVDAYLERQHTTIIERLHIIERSDDSLPVKIVRIFDLLATATAQNSYRGCLFVVAAIEQPQSDLPAKRWARVHKMAVLSTFRNIFEDADHPHAAEVAEQLAIIYDGTLVTAAIRPESGAIERGRAMALAVIDSYR
ncbi:transcriptional regulator, TetR family protein (plasmid) [Rhodococcus jostii RHA1]|uniref:Transcriptional regulator, TetR family protein n=1 Tax=Rhodococcus jostii (strain RHA1) TaxID=101510 RepID=Q0RXN8_RHOJR|nr:TetR/AcrR family transcriptional regulator [Rhodococcus jostii]ABG99948.1 transcriptional regulator, TetR family protein [Rhodococcus jostii RHA1]